MPAEYFASHEEDITESNKYSPYPPIRCNKDCLRLPPGISVQPKLPQSKTTISAAGALLQPSALVMTAMVTVVCTAFSSQMALPLWVGAIIDDYSLTAERAGIVAAIEYAAVAIVSVAIATQVHRLNLKNVSIIGMLCLLIGNGSAGFSTDFASLSLSRGLAGTGKGLVIAAIFSLAARTPTPTKAFAIINGAYTALATIIYLSLPFPIEAAGAPGAFWSLFAIALAGAAFLFWVPATKAVDTVKKDINDRPKIKLSLSGLLVLLALILMWAANGSIWVYVERIGQRTGLSLPQIGTILSASAAVAVLGPVLAHQIHDRFGFRKPIVLGACVKISAALILCNWLTPLPYMIAAPLFVLAALFIVPYLMSLMSLADPTGRLAAAAGGLLTAGSSLGAYLGGVTLTYGNTPTLSIVAVTLLVGMMIIVHVAISKLGVSPVRGGECGEPLTTKQR